MLRPLTLAALLSSLPAVAPAQSAARSLAPGGAPICDGSEMRQLERRRQLGGGLAIGTLLGNAVVFGLSTGSPNPADAPRAIENGRRAMTFALLTLPVALVGAHMYASGYPDEAFWTRTLARTRLGETTSADIRACLAEPAATSSAGAEETWTYFTRRSHGWLSRGSAAAVSFTFRSGVLSEVRRSQVNLDRLWPGTRAVPVAVPVP